MAATIGNNRTNGMQRSIPPLVANLDETCVELSWKRCADWLTRCQLLPANHRLIVDPKATVMDLVTLLRDGVLLCHLLPVLSDGRIRLKDLKDFNARPLNCQFLCLRNIRLFLMQCQQYFGLSKGELFDAADIFELRNLAKVVGCLSRLSCCPVVRTVRIDGFELKLDNEEDDYYNAFELQAASQDLVGVDDCQEDIYDVVDNENEKIYDTVVRATHTVERQASTGGGFVAKTAREMCIKEILDTEKNYVDALKMLLDEFKKPLQSVLSRDEITKIFFLMEDLRDIHIEFFRDLTLATESSVKKWSLHEVFLRVKDKLLIYADYCGHMQSAQRIVEEISKHDNEKSKAIAKCQKTASFNKFKLTELLALPMQRILKYHLLLDALIKHSKTCEEHELEGLRRAHYEMTDLGKYINEVKKDFELIASIDEIQRSIIDLQMPLNFPKLSDYGRLQKDGELRVAEHIPSSLPSSRTNSHRSSNFKSRYVFLFDKVVIICKSRAGGENYVYKDVFQLNQFQLLEQDTAATNNDKFTFTLVNRDVSSRSFHFIARNALLLRQWIKAVNEALDNNYPAQCTGHSCSFEMASFTKPTYCGVCHQLLHGVFFQGYRCKISNIVVHKACIVDAAQLTTSLNSLPSRLPSRNFAMEGPSLTVVRAYTGQPVPQHSSAPLLLLQEGDTVILSEAEPSQVWWEGRHAVSGAHGVFSSYSLAPMSSPSCVVKCCADLVTDCCEGASLAGHTWYVGRMTRDHAAYRLAQCPEGTFLVRLSVQRNGEFSISLKHQDDVKHMKIERSTTSTNEGLWYLSGVRYFSSIVELIDYYSSHSLCESFTALQNVRFGTSLSEAELCVDSDFVKCRSSQDVTGLYSATVICNYSSEVNNTLTIKIGDRVTILSKTCDNRYWLKAVLNGRVGFVPRAYLEEDSQLP